MPTTKVFLQTLNVHVDVNTDLLSCSACKSILPLNFKTYECKHRFCSSCTTDRCAQCSTTTVLPVDPVLFEALKNCPRVAPCGQKIPDAVAYCSHINTCAKCLQKMIQTHNTVMSLQSELATMKRKFALVDKTNQLLRKNMSDQIHKYETLKENLASRKSRRVIVTDDDHD
jgi:hypothetical protein